MPYDIGPRIGIDGETEFRKQLSNISMQVKTLGTEMTALSSEFASEGASMDQLRKRGELLQQSYDAQAKKVEEISKALAVSRERYDENDSHTLKWRQSLAQAQTQLNNIQGEIDKNNTAMDEYGKKTEEMVEKSGKLKDGLATLAKGAAAAATAVGAIAVKLGKDVLAAFSEYEQLAGGVETLFDAEGAKRVADDAAQAYRTAGLSANEYLETVTSFSASLIKSLDGDTKAAAAAANVAITDMADNANKFGSDITSLQNAYKGFARGNFTMLDNLSLGYAGTKEGMESLIDEANRLNAAQGKYTDYSIDSYADIVEAIHVVQESMGVAGATAQEAEGTVAGSVAAMKSAAQNLLAGFADANADVGLLTSELLRSFTTMLSNVLPVFQRLGESLPKALGKALKDAAPIIPEILATVTGLMTSILAGITEALPTIADSALAVATTFLQGIVAQLPGFVTAASQIIASLIRGISGALPDLIAMLPQIITAIITTLSANFPEILSAGVQLLGALIKGILQAIPELVRNIPQIVSAVVGGISAAVDQIRQVGRNLMDGLWNGISDKVAWLKTQIRGVVDKIKSWFTGSSGFDTHSPSKWSESVFRNVMEGGAVGIRKGESVLDRSIGTAIGNAQAALSSPLRISAAGYGSAASVGSGSPAGASAGIQDATIIVQSVLDGKIIGETAVRYSDRVRRATK